MAPFIISMVGSVIAAVCVLLARLAFYKIKDHFPAGSLFGNAIRQDQETHVYILRMKDAARAGDYVTPVPQSGVTTSQPEFEPRKLTPWVTSVHEALSAGHILNVLGQCNKTRNVRVCFVDRDFDRWDVPMFLLGGSRKADRAFQTCNPVFDFTGTAVHLSATGEAFEPSDIDHDIGLLQKMLCPTTGFPIWVAKGWRGAGTSAASYALLRFWRELAVLYGSKTFGILFEFSDHEGWQHARIRRMHPEPRMIWKLLHPVSWRRIASMRKG